MGIKERREREKQITRQAILTAALQIAQQEGWSALTIRKVGDLIEYSPPMVYEYFANKDDILLHLLHEGFHRLTAALQQARASTQITDEWVVRMADAYWNFARSNSELYQLMHGLGGVPLDRSVVADAVLEVCTVTQDALLDWARDKGVVLPDPLGATEIIWCLLHGLVSLSLIDRVEGGEQRARGLMHQALQNQLMAWNTIYKNP